MAEKYHAEEDKTRRLNNTVCLYDGQPVYVVTRVGWRSDKPLGEEEVYITDLGKSCDVYDPVDWKRVSYTSDSFSYEAFPLGYVNYKGSCYYLVRAPVQAQSQGLCSSNLILPSDCWHRIWMSLQMADCILNKYPTLTDALKEVTTKQVDSIAFHRRFCLGRFGRTKITLSFQDRIIGFYSEKKKSFTIFKSSDNRFMSQLLNSMDIKHVIEDD